MLRKSIIGITCIVSMLCFNCTAIAAEAPVEAQELYGILTEQLESGKYDFDKRTDTVRFISGDELVNALDDVNAICSKSDDGAYVRLQDVYSVSAQEYNAVVSAVSAVTESKSDFSVRYSLSGANFISIDLDELFDFISNFEREADGDIFEAKLITKSFSGYDAARPVQYDEDDVRNKCTLSADEINAALFGELEGYADKLIELQSEYGIGLDYAVAVADLETKCGTLGYGKTKSNLFNIRYNSGEYKDYTGEEDPVAASLEDFFKLISQEYVDPNGDYSCGADIDSIGVIYAENPNWSETVKSCVWGFYNRAAMGNL